MKRCFRLEQETDQSWDGIGSTTAADHKPSPLYKLLGFGHTNLSSPVGFQGLKMGSGGKYPLLPRYQLVLDSMQDTQSGCSSAS